jgi:cyclophilin family peptidyl-prolyl cis-trans isomerase
MTRAALFRVVAVLAIPLLLAACSSSSTAALPTIPPLPSETPTAAPTHPGPTYPPGCPTSQPAAMAKDAAKTVTIKTDKGDIVIKVEGALSPIAAGNFVALAQCGYYDNVVFFRADPAALLQGGDGQFGRSPDVIPDLVGSGGPPYTIKDEPVTGSYTRGTVAMARSSTPDSARSQFFIVSKDFPKGTQALPYQIFGHVTSGMSVVDAISALPTGGGPGFLFATPVVMTKVTVSNP